MEKTIFITGASSGLGKATAKLFAEKGWKVIATMRNPEKETELSQMENVFLFCCYTGLALAEQRMAALTRLHLNTKQMASMLGISPDSVYKIRQRLRKRLQLDDEVTTETYLTKI